MNKEVLKKSQPTVYRTLSNAIKYNRLAHAYMFTGAQENLKRETALLFAQSIICSHRDEDGFACQECDSCKRIEKGESVDLVWLPKKKEERIKKQDIIKLQDFCMSTSSQEESKKIYVLDHFDEITKSASNSLLKTIEEPIDNLFAILIVNEKANVLPTIVSRCQIVTFRPISNYETQKQLEKVLDYDDAIMLSQNGYSYEEAVQIAENENFIKIKEGTKQYMEYLDSMDRIYYLSTEVFIYKTEIMSKEYIKYFLQWMLYFIKNADQYTLEQKVKVQEICIESLDRLRTPVDLALFLDKIYNQVRKAVSE